MSESFFMFLEWGLLGGGQQKESASEVAEESAEALVEVSGDTRVTLGACEGVSMRRGVTGPFLLEEKDDWNADCGRGVAVSIF